MKLEKFDYNINNRKTKRQLVLLGSLCLALVITVALYKTVANFSHTTSYSIIGGRVAPFNDSRRALVTKDISLSANDKVNGILYDDGSLAISGTGNMKNFSGNDLVGEILDDYVKAKVTFTQEETTFITNNTKLIHSLIDIIARPWNFEVKDEDVDKFITEKFTTKAEDPNEEDIVDEVSINTIKSILEKVKESNFYIEKIEFNEGVTSIGTNAFALLAATNESDIRDKEVYKAFYEGVDYATNPNMPMLFNVISLNSNIDEVRTHGTSDLVATGIVIDSSVTKIPEDMFAYYEGVNSSLVIPNSVKTIGNSAFYSFKGNAITLPNNVELIDTYAFASFTTGEITIPDSLTTYKADVFKSFTGTIHVNACESDELHLFAPLATVFDYTKQDCEPVQNEGN